MGKLISISIDLCRSTEVKSRINDLCGSDVDRKRQLMDDYFRRLFLIETDFYFHCIYNGLAMERLYLVKGIGDELWFVYSLEGFTVEQASSEFKAIYEACCVVASRDRDLFISDKEITWELEEKLGELAWQNTEFEHFSLPSKVFIDLIEDYYSVSPARASHVFPNLRANLKSAIKDLPSMGGGLQDKVPQLKKLDLAELCESLNLGLYVGDKLTRLRFDPIGADVDLFFRCTGKSLPGLVRIGEKLFNYLKHKEDKKLWIVACRLEKGGMRMMNERFIVEDYKKGAFKGVNHDYSLYTPIRISSLSGAFFSDPHRENNGLNDSKRYLVKNGVLKRKKKGLYMMTDDYRNSN